MPLKIIREDITKIKCDAIVNAANSTLLGGGGVDGAIHKAAGKGLLLECMKLGGCKTGEAKITKGYKLPCKFVIHTVGPKWKDGSNGEEGLLRSCYRKSLKLASDNNCESMAFPLISSGVYGYPKEQALQIAIDEITAFLSDNDKLIYIVIYDKASFKISEKLYGDIVSYIDDNYVDENSLFDRSRILENECQTFYDAVPSSFPTQFCEETEVSVPAKSKIFETESKNIQSLDDMLKEIDESFSEMLLRKIDENGMTDAECYKKANIDRKLFSKIRGDRLYKPSKPTALAFAIALELSLPETKDMLQKAGFALSHSNKFDIIIEYFITNNNYNIFEINEALFAFDQNLLGV